MHFQKSVVSNFIKCDLLSLFQNKTQSHGGLHTWGLWSFLHVNNSHSVALLLLLLFEILKNCGRPICFLHASNFCILIGFRTLNAEFGFNTYHLNPSGYAYQRRPRITDSLAHIKGIYSPNLCSMVSLVFSLTIPNSSFVFERTAWPPISR